MKKFIAIIMAIFALGGSAACHGSFSLTGKYNGFIKSIGNKWIRWIVFLISFWIGGLFLVADAIIFNSIEFWLGRNVIGMEEFDQNGEHIKIVKKGDETATFIYREFGNSLEIQIEKNGRIKKQALLHKDQVGVLYNKENSAWIPYTVQETVASNFTSLKIMRAHKEAQNFNLTAEEIAKIDNRGAELLQAIR